MTTLGRIPLTHARLQELLHYNPTTGIFTWLIDRTGKAKVGAQAGGRGGKGYINISIDGKLYKAHRLAWFYMTKSWPVLGLDHQNTIKSDNSWNNLRQATQKDNNGNSNMRKDNKSGIKGVRLVKSTGKFTAHMTWNKKAKHLGTYKTKEEAAAAYATAAREYFGEFART